MAQQNVIEYFTIATTGNATDFGDLISTRGTSMGALCDGTKGIVAAGGQDSSGGTDAIDVVNVASTGNSTDFGNLTNSRHSVAGLCNLTRGIFAGGRETTGGSARQNTIDYVTVASLGNATDFGDLLAVKAGSSGASGD